MLPRTGGGRFPYLSSTLRLCRMPPLLPFPSGSVPVTPASSNSRTAARRRWIEGTWYWRPAKPTARDLCHDLSIIPDVVGTPCAYGKDAVAMSVRSVLHCTIGGALVVTASFASAAQYDSGDLSADLRWRLLGPFRAGWSSVAAGIPGQPDTFYFGAASGGVWKTTNAGQTWQPIFDAVPAANIGVLAIAPSNASVIYVGTGQVTSRYDLAAGNGVYKSTDAGKTWQHIGLDATRHIGAILVDAHDANTVLIGALGHYFGPNRERGVFRSEDGGKTWRQTLFIDADTGVADLRADPENPAIVYAAAWQVRNYPWLSYFQPNAGPGSGLFRSSDSGKTWTRSRGAGWPDGALGRIGLATASGGRVYAVVDAAPNGGTTHRESSHDRGGLYRSDDGGANWVLASQESWLQNDYFSSLTVDPGNRDRIYAMGQSVRRSDDAGNSWIIVKGAPGGDDYHQMWINPQDPKRMVVASDQGTVVSVDGGTHWSDWYNQPTGQFYHLAADNRFPYWVYSGQQDSGTVAIASRSDYGVLSFRDWHPVGADERDYDVPDPENADIVYGSGLGGRLSRWDARTGQVQNISPWPLSGYGQRPTDFKYHYTWITPIAVSQKWPFALYQGAQVLFRSLDKGQTWATVSPDLSAKSPDAQHCEGDLGLAAARACGYGVIYSIGLSPRDNDEIWIGTDDGLIQTTHDGGKHWDNVTPKQIPPWAKVATIEVSPTTPGDVYAAIDNHRQDDFRPQVLRTRDAGKTWSEIVQGLPATGFVDVVRADPIKSGLLYAGTDSGVFVSFDDGEHWQSLQRNLPAAWVRDLLVHGDDLIVATQGRAIWVLDDVSPLRQHDRLGGKSARAILFEPAVAMRLRGSQNKDTPPPPDTALGQNPPTGAVLDYVLAHDAQNVALEFRDAAGEVMRRFANDEPEQVPRAERYFTDAWTQSPTPLSAAAGAHRFVWNLRLPRPRAVHYDYSIGGVFGEDTPIVPEGMLVLPGNYQAVLTVDGHESRVPLKVAADPRVVLDATAMRDALEFSKQIDAALERDYVGYGQLRAVDGLIDKAGEGKSDKALLAAIAKFKDASKPLLAGEGDASENFATLGEVLSSLAADIEGSDRTPTRPQRDLLAATNQRLDRAARRWDQIRAGELAQLKARFRAAGLADITVPEAEQIQLERAPEGKELP